MSAPRRRLVLALVLIAASHGAGHAAGAAKKPATATATGRVLDVHGRPVAGAVVEISITNQDYRSVTIGHGTTDADGRFALELSTTKHGDLGLGVDAPGFEHWGWAGFPKGIVDEEIVLGRVVDRGFLERLRSVRDPAARARAALEVAYSDDLPEVEELFPYLDELRPELAAMVRAKTAEPKRRRDGATPAENALRLLAYRADPADDDLVEAWMKEHWSARRPAPAALFGASIYDVCSRWDELHFADQGERDHPPGICQRPVFDRGGRHALVLWRVDYMHWGYSMHLVMRREGDRWVLRGVTDDTIYHYRRD